LKSLPDFADRVIVMCDSGSFSVLKKKAKIKLEDYIAYLQAKWDVIDHAINLDRIGEGRRSYDNYKIMTAERLDVVPVYHLGTDRNYLCAYLDMADFVGISLRKGSDPKTQIPELDDLWEYYLTDRYRYLRIITTTMNLKSNVRNNSPGSVCGNLLIFFVIQAPLPYFVFPQRSLKPDTLTRSGKGRSAPCLSLVPPRFLNISSEALFCHSENIILPAILSLQRFV
jgi:hypothetical protein